MTARRGQEHRTIDDSDHIPIDGLASGSANLCIGADIVEANRDPELATAWTKLRAIQNNDNIHGKTFDADSYHDTPIEIIAAASLGIDGCSLQGFGLTSDVSPASSGAVPPGTTDTAPAVFATPVSRQSAWDSELKLLDLEPMDDASDWEVISSR